MALASFAPRSCASLPCRAASPSTSVFAAWNRRARNCQAHSVFFPRCVKLQICPWRVDDRHTRIPQFLFARPCRTPRSDSLDPVRRRAFAARRGCLPSASAFGGTMHNKVVYQTAKSLDAIGIPVLRFNFRGAGLSAGVHDRGLGEQGDVRAALDFLASEFPGVPLLLAGFSFGCSVGMRVGCQDPRVSHLIGLGIPVNSTDFSFLRQCKKPKLFVQGSNDEHGAIAKVKALIPTLPGDNH